MASRFLLLRAADAARSARGPAAGLMCAPPTDPPLGVFCIARSLAGRVPALQGRRHYGTPFNRYTNIAELNVALRKVEKRLEALEEKCNTKHKRSIKDIFDKYKPCSHRENVEMLDIEENIRRFSNVIMFMGFGFTFGTILYYYC